VLGNALSFRVFGVFRGFNRFFWQRWKNHRANFLLARIAPLAALRRFRTMKG
jgi:hypothetical protein